MLLIGQQLCLETGVTYGGREGSAGRVSVELSTTKLWQGVQCRLRRTVNQHLLNQLEQHSENVTNQSAAHTAQPPPFVA